MKVIFLDTETTSIWKDRWMIQLAYKIIENWKVVKIYNEYFRTQKKIEIWAKAIHNITEDILDQEGINLKDNQIFAEINTDLFWSYIIAHNSDFDKETLKIEWFNVDNYQWIDSQIIAYNLLTEDMVEAYNLQYLRYYFYPQDIEFSEGIIAHNALWDILVLEKVFEQLEKLFIEYNKWAIKIEKGSEWLYRRMVDNTDKWVILRICKFPKHRWELWSEVEKKDPGFIDWVWKNIDMDKKLENTILDLITSRNEK